MHGHYAKLLFAPLFLNGLVAILLKHASASSIDPASLSDWSNSADPLAAVLPEALCYQICFGTQLRRP